jgi:hypothetical protein
MSLITQQLLLQARSARDDILHRISVGEDTSVVREHLSGSNKRVAKLEAQLLSERAAFAAKKQALDEKSANEKKPRAYAEKRSSEARPPLLEDVMLACNDCSSPFTFTGKDQAFFNKNGWSHPSRCTDCRETKKGVKPPGADLSCCDCKETFFFSDAKSRIFEENGWEQPKRCSECSKKHKSLAPMTIECRGCKKDVTFSVRAQKEFKAKGWAPPKSCKECHYKKAEAPAPAAADE